MKENWKSTFILGIQKLFGRAVFSLYLLFLTINFAYAEDNAEQLSQNISDNVMSPFCPGRTLSSCPSPQAKDLRDQIVTWVKSGETEVSVFERLKSIYGMEITGTPQTTGFGLLGWVMPGIFIVSLLICIYFWLKKMKTEKSDKVTSLDQKESALKEEIEKELKIRMMQ